MQVVQELQVLLDKEVELVLEILELVLEKVELKLHLKEVLHRQLVKAVVLEFQAQVVESELVKEVEPPQQVLVGLKLQEVELELVQDHLVE